MKVDIIVAGVSEQEVLATASLLSLSAIRANLHVGQSPVFRRPERRSAFVCHVRMADREIASPVIASGEADLILGLEPLETLHATDHLSPAGAVITSVVPVRDIDPYPDEMDLLWSIIRHPRAHLINARRLAHEAGAFDSAFVALIGAAMDHLPIEPEHVRRTIVDVFHSEGPRAVDENIAALAAGMATLPSREIVDEFETLAKR